MARPVDEERILDELIRERPAGGSVVVRRRVAIVDDVIDAVVAAR
jgi:hypothetical protein